jgi:putative PIN family toxin of toxin-antitoxin system
MRLVLDMNVIVAGLRSPEGASAALIERALDQAFVPVLSIALALEYEDVAMDPVQRIVSGLDEDEVRTVISAICAVSEPVESHFLWRPQLRDPADEMVLEAAINGQAEAIVTFNRRDFGAAPARFGIEVWAPRDALKKVGA